MPTVAACQAAVADCDPDANLAALGERLAGLPDRVDLAVFPECGLTGFVADDRLAGAALERDGPHLDRVADLAAAHDLAVVVGFVERAGDDLYNATAYVPPRGERRYYRKRHRWGGEREWLAPGDERVIVDTPLGRTGLLACHDLNYVADSAALTDERVDALVVVGAWPAAHAANWDLLVRARALDGVRWVVAAGRTGRRDVPDAAPATYAGHSRVVRPDGSVAAGANRGERDVVVDCDPAVLAEIREFVPVLSGDDE